MKYLVALFSSDDAAADVIAWAGALSVLVLGALAFYEAVNGHPPGITETGTGLASVIGAAGAVRVSRERFAKKEP